MQQELENRVKMCFSAYNFIKCYDNPEEPCSAEIYTDFLNFLKTYDPRVLEMYKELPGAMPDC